MKKVDEVLDSGEICAVSGGLYSRAGKRLFDIVFAATGLAITSPLFLFCAIAVPVLSRGPVFFRQARIGQFGLPFRIFKFRSMVQNREGLGITAAGDPRVTRFGKWLRRTKIDEIPQLLNVLRGDMSFVGPRPEVPEYVATYSSLQRRVLQMKPGITGLAALRFVDEEQVIGHSSDPDAFYRTVLLPHKLELELPYCRNVTFWRDAKLIALTVKHLLFRSRGSAATLLNGG